MINKGISQTSTTRSSGAMGAPLEIPGVILDGKTSKLVMSVIGIMSTLVIYGVLQEKIMRVPYGGEKAYFKYSLFLVLCNRVFTSTAAAIFLLASKKVIGPVAPLYKYGIVSLSNILTTTCQYEALKYVSFPVQTLAKCAKMIPVMVWGTIIMQKRYNGRDYLLALLVTTGCALFILYPASEDITPYNKEKESTFWGIFLMMGYLGFDGFTSTFQDKLFKGYNMEIYTQIFYTTLCSCAISMIGLLIQGHFLPAIDFIFHHRDCLFDVTLLSMVATASQFFISYTIRTFGALTFATIMTTRQLISILLSCIWFAHPLSWKQWIGAVVVFSSLYSKSFFNAQGKRADLTKQQKQSETEEEIALLNKDKLSVFSSHLGALWRASHLEEGFIINNNCRVIWINSIYVFWFNSNFNMISELRLVFKGMGLVLEYSVNPPSVFNPSLIDSMGVLDVAGSIPLESFSLTTTSTSQLAY